MPPWGFCLSDDCREENKMTDLKKKSGHLYAFLRRNFPIITVVSLAAALLLLTGPATWAIPGQSPERQTVPSPSPKETEVWPPPTPVPLGCGECVRKKIGPEGGEIDLPTNRILVTVPPGSLAEEIEFTLCIPCECECGGCRSVEGVPCLPCDVFFTLEGWLVENGQKVPHDYRFVSPMGITIGYTDQTLDGVGGDPHNLVLGYCDETTGGWVPLDPIVDERNHNVSAAVDHLSWFGLLCCSPVTDLPETGGEEAGWRWQPALLGVLLMSAGALFSIRVRSGKI
jgi:hypothetical protein